MELCDLCATDLTVGYRSGDFSASEALESVLERIGARDGEINAIATLDIEAARAAARDADARVRDGSAHPLCGIPITIKDLIYTRGLRTTGGSRLYRDFVPDVDSAVVERVRAAGAVIVGKSNTCEFGHKLTGDSALFGIVRNPRNPKRTTGGSSGGAAAGLAAGYGPLAIGTDAVGSIRVPAAFCGVVGLKPSYGLVPRAPGFAPSWDSLAHTGPMSRTVADAAQLLAVIGGPDDRDRGSLPASPDYRSPLSYADVDLRNMRIGFTPDLGYAPVDPGVAAAIAEAVAALRAAGLDIVEDGPGFADPLEDVLRPIGLSELAASRADDSQSEHALLDPSLQSVLAATPPWSAVDFVRATTKRTQLWRTLRALFNRVDALLLPTVPIPAFAVGEIGVDRIAGRAVDRHLGWCPFTFPFNLAGLPALTVPARLTADGMPVGLQFVGPRYTEATLLALGAAYERVREKQQPLQ